MQTPAILYSDTLDAIKTLPAGNTPAVEVGIHSNYVGDKAGPSGWLHDLSSGANSKGTIGFFESKTIATTIPGVSEVYGAMAGYVDSLTAESTAKNEYIWNATGIDYSSFLKTVDPASCIIYAPDRSNLFVAGLEYETAYISVESDTSYSRPENFMSGFKCFVGAGSGAGGGRPSDCATSYDVRYRRNPIRL